MTVALLLAEYGVASTIYEAKPERDPIGSKALCMQRDVLDILERVGCGRPLVDEGVTWQMGRTYYRDAELFQITFHDAGISAFPPFVNVGQDRTEFHLERAVDAEPLAEMHYASPVIDVGEDDNGVVIAAGSREPARFDYLVGADGARSTIRKLLGLDFPGRSFTDQFLICDIRAQLPFENERRFFFDPEWNPDRQVLIHPQADSVWRIDWQVPPDYDLDHDQTSGGLDERIRKIVGDQDYEIVWMSVYRFHERIASAFRAGRSFLAGDAAHIVSPFGARGLNSGVQDADNVAWKIAFVLNGWADDALLDTYELERRPAAEENLRVAGTTMEFLVPQTEEGWEIRRRTLNAAVGNPRAREMVDSGRLAEPYWYTESPLTTIGPHDPEMMNTPPGTARPIVPGVLCPDAPCAVPGRADIDRIRELFGRGFTLLTVGDPHWAVAAAAGRSDAPVAGFDLEVIEPEGLMRGALQLGHGEAALVRPDGHIAALELSDSLAVAAAISTALAR
jgi:2-polyprenyl-6-methoxyphenol hydroxylase-like FAD-dependent oxidoreductase